MRFLTLLAAALITMPAAASGCANDYSGTQRTTGYDYEIDFESTVARDAWGFVDAASNWLYFTDEGHALQDDLVFFFRLEGLPVHLPACNDIGQCAAISIQSEPLELWSITLPFAHGGFTITASFGGETNSRFLQTGNDVAWNVLSITAALDKRCRDNYGNLIDEPQSENDGESDGEEFDEAEEDSYNDDEADWDDSYADEDEGESCENCEFYFDGDEDGELDPDPYGPTEEEVVEV